ncbi:MAG TPA: hypothetical protein VGM81_01310 [Burkholderiaceae bacterium]|jgi:Tol biopolymer transport system component
MDRRKFLIGAPSALLAAQLPLSAFAQSGEKKNKGLFLLNRIGPSAAQIYVANADGTGERKLIDSGTLDYNASFSADGKWIVFTSERDGLGNANIYRARADGSEAERLVDSPNVDDAAVLSPDGSKLAFVSTRDGFFANIWVLDIQTKKLTNMTGRAGIQGEAGKPNGFYRPSWSPDGQWLAFSSDRNTEWKGHHNGAGWEHTQELGIYILRVDGTGFRQIAGKPTWCTGSPKWSPDGKRVVFYETLAEYTFWALRPDLLPQTESQIVSVDVATGARIEHTSGPGMKIGPQYLSMDEIVYRRKGGPAAGLYSTAGKTVVKIEQLRTPSWSADGKQILYDKFTFRGWKQNQPLYSWDANVDTQYTDVWPGFSKDGMMVLTEKGDNSSIAIMRPDGSEKKRIFDTATSDLSPMLIKRGLAGAFYPVWSPDDQWIAFGLGNWFTERGNGPSKIMRVRRDGSGLEALTDASIFNAGFPSYSADGKEIVFRVWSKGQFGLQVINLETRKVRVLTTENDNLPSWSPDGQRIMFTRGVKEAGSIWANFDICTIKPDGTDLRRLTTAKSSDGHAVWTKGGKQILWNSAEHGYRDEAVLYDNTFQPYGQVWLMNADGSDKRQITDSPWEDSTPQYAPQYAPQR